MYSNKTDKATYNSLTLYDNKTLSSGQRDKMKMKKKKKMNKENATTSITYLMTPESSLQNDNKKLITEMRTYLEANRKFNTEYLSENNKGKNFLSLIITLINACK